MFDNTEEDKDVANQVSKGSSGASKDENNLEVIGSPVTPEKLDPNMELGAKAGNSSDGPKKE